MERSMFALFLMHVIGFIGAVLAAIVFWDDERIVAYTAIATVLIILVLSNHVLGEVATSVGFGYFGYALTDRFAVAIVALILGESVMMAISRYRIRKRDRLVAAHLEAKSDDLPEPRQEA